KGLTSLSLGRASVNFWFLSVEATSWASHGFLWHNGVITDLGTLLPSFGLSSIPFGMHDSGQVARISATEISPGMFAIVHFFWQTGIDLGALKPEDSRVASVINSSGMVVGLGPFRGGIRGGPCLSVLEGRNDWSRFTPEYHIEHCFGDQL